MVESACTSDLLSPQRWNLLQLCLVCTYTLGFTGIWTFPCLIYQHTGLFLVAYYILLVGLCLPIVYVQIKLGGLLKAEITTIFSIFIPALKGVSLSLLLIVFVQLIYHNVYVAYAIYYMFACFANPYPWAEAVNSTFTSVRITDRFLYFAHSPGEDYFFNQFLQMSPSISQPGGVPWYLGVTLLFSWVLVFALICRGPAWFGRVIYGTGSLGLLLLMVLLIYGHVTVPKSHDSLKKFFIQQNKTAKLSELNKNVLESQLSAPLTWIHALEQHIYSIGLWAGILPTIGKNLANKKPASNIAWLVVLLVHGMLPHLATVAMVPFIHVLVVEQGLPFDLIIKQGPQMIFLFMPEAFAVARVPSLCAVTFYLFFIIFALHKQGLLLLVVMENLVESFPRSVLLVFRRRELLALTLCGLAYLLGLPNVTQGGWHMLSLVDRYLCRLHFLPILLSVPAFVLAYVRQEAFNLPIERLFLCIWFAVSSLSICAVLLYNLIVFIAPYPTPSLVEGWTQHLGACLAVAPVLIGLAAGIGHALYTAKGTMYERFKLIWKPTIGSIAEHCETDFDLDDVAKTKAKNAKASRKRALKTELEVNLTPASNGEVTQL